jgi:serine/threonine protein kinase
VHAQVEQAHTNDASTRNKVKACVRELEGEIKTLQKLKHPNIVQYLGFERTDTHFNIFLEWMPGGSIRKLLDEFGVWLL